MHDDAHSVVFFFSDTSTTEIYTLSLHDALPILHLSSAAIADHVVYVGLMGHFHPSNLRSEEHTSELQSLRHLVCRLLLEKKKNKRIKHMAEILSVSMEDISFDNGDIKVDCHNAS